MERAHVVYAGGAAAQPTGTECTISKPCLQISTRGKETISRNGSKFLSLKSPSVDWRSKSTWSANSIETGVSNLTDYPG